MASGDDEEVQIPVIAPKKGGNRMVMVMGVMVLVLLGVCGYLFVGVRARAKTTPEGAPAVESASKAAPELYLPLDPAFVVNFEDQDATRYLQVGVTVMTRDPAAMQALKDSDPVVRNALVMLFSSQTYMQLSDTAGKQKLQAEALAAVRKIVADKIGKPSVDALYFTSFVMQ